MQGTGVLSDYNVYPLVWAGGWTGPLLFNPPAEIETPEIYRLGVGQAVSFRRWGFPAGQLGPGWGLGDETRQLDPYDQHMSPADASERVHMFDVQRCNELDEAEIATTGTAFELVRWTSIPSASVGVLERIPTVFEAQALDANGAVIFTWPYEQLNGERTCMFRLVHPEVGVNDLTWRWHLTADRISALPGAPEPYIGPVPPSGVQGDNILPPWTDLRYGHLWPWGEKHQFVLQPRTRLRYWIVLFGPADRYRVTVGARLGGYWQLGGRKGAALSAALHRTE